VPVLTGTALRNKGIHPLLDAVMAFCRRLPTCRRCTGVDPRDTSESCARAQERRAVAALAFKIAMDEGRKVVFLRLFSGTIEAGDDLLNVRTGKKEKMRGCFAARGQARAAGEGVRRRDRRGGRAQGRHHRRHHVRPQGNPILLERIDTYEPVISQAIEAENAAAKERLDFALAKMVEEDPTFRSRRTPTPARPSSAAWASCTSRSSSTA
jgi:elongation factor G